MSGVVGTIQTAEEAPRVLTPVSVPESVSYRLKRVLLGPPLVSGRLRHQRLSKRVALGVLSPDCISSSAYGSEEMLRILVPVIGTAAFSLLLPVTGAILLVLLLVTLCYRDVVMVYTKVGGSYAVSRDNFGLPVAQVAAVALLIDYVVTVAVQTAAGTDAVISLFHLLLGGSTALDPYALEITIAVTTVLCYGNLRGIREAGRAFALPTYLFAGSVGLMIVIGLVRAMLGNLPRADVHAHGAVPLGHPGGGLLMGASVFYLLRSFANGGSSLTGLEAISDSVPAFAAPTGPNARRTLVWMASLLAFLVGGVSVLAHLTHAMPFTVGTPTVIAQEARLVLGNSMAGKVGFTLVQVFTALILYTGANTSFNGFPFLASYVAGDSFLPRQLTHRGHRLAFSNGILLLYAAAVVLLVATGSSVDRLVAVYAIGVFTSFTMAAAGMVQYHRRHGGGRLIQAIDVAAAVISGLVVVIFAVTKFTQGAWVVVVLFPLMVWGLHRTHARYVTEDAAVDAVPAGREANFVRHEVLVLVDGVDVAVVRALRYARSIRPTRVRAVHFAIDDWRAERLRARWERHEAATDTPLEMLDCPDRRIARAAAEAAARAAADGRTEVTVLLPRRTRRSPLGRLLHDRTADAIADALTALPHVAATILPFHVGARAVPDGTSEQELQPVAQRRPGGGAGRPARRPAGLAAAGAPSVPVREVVWRRRAVVEGRVTSVEATPSSRPAALRATLVDDSGGIELLFHGRRHIPGIRPGAVLRAEGMVGQVEGTLAITNPAYELLGD